MLDKQKNSTVEIQTIVSGIDFQPYVQFSWTDPVTGNALKAQLSVPDAWDHARMLMEAACIAELDAMIYDFFMNTVGSSAEETAQLLTAFRQYRDNKSNKGTRHE